MRLIKEQKGTVTIYLALIFMVMIVFTGVFIDLARIRLAQNQLRRITNSAARSVLASYNPALKNEYGVFVVNNDIDCQGEFRKYIELNLDSFSSKNFKLLNCNYENSQLVLSQPLDNLTALKRQVLEEMKYSAPIEISRDLIDKFRAAGSLAGFFGEQNQRRKTVKSVTAKIGDIGEINDRINEKKDKLRQDKLYLRNINEQLDSLNRTGKPEDAGQIKDLEKQKERTLKQIAQDKEEILAEINVSKSKRLEIQQEVDRLAKGDEDPQSVAANTTADPLADLLQINLDNFRKENFDVLVSDLQEIKTNTEQAETALAGITTDDEIDEFLFAKIELAPLGRINSKYNNSTLSGYQDLWQNLAVSRSVYLERYIRDPLLGNSIVPEEQVTDVVNYRSVGETDQKLDIQEQMLTQVSDILNVDKKLNDMRNELYINEYLLTHCSHITGEHKGSPAYDKRNIESEYVLYGSHALEKAIAELYMTRFTLDTLGYLAFAQPPAPVELISRSIYSLIMGAMQASVDTYKLLVDGSNTVNLIEMMPDNPMEKLNLALTYKDHLRLFMLLHSDEQGKLKRLLEVIRQRNGVDVTKAFTLVNGRAQVSIRLWFLPLTGLNNTKNGPFNTEIRNGRCYILKDVEFGY